MIALEEVKFIDFVGLFLAGMLLELIVELYQQGEHFVDQNVRDFSYTAQQLYLFGSADLRIFLVEHFVQDLYFWDVSVSCEEIFEKRIRL